MVGDRALMPKLAPIFCRLIRCRTLLRKARKLADHSKKIGARPPKVGILPKALFSHCSVVFCCLSGNDLNSLLNDEDDKTILQQILEHFDGVGDEATQEGSSKKGLVLISPMESKTLEQTIQDLSQYSNHVDVVGVGILGSKKGATVYVSGPRSLYDRCEGALQLIGSSILYAGDQSSPGQALMWSMLMNQLSMGIMKEVMATRALAQQFLIDDASLARMLVDHQKDNCWQSFVAAGLGAKTSSIKDVLGLTEYGRWNAKAAVLSSANAPQGPSKGMYVHSHLAQMMEHSTAEDETVVDTLAKAIGLGSD
uniref:Uncharacterized protein n=1 Tax=Plectus sambesii TaxID=2011161 RepID=A0A914WL35_9BILA